MDSPFSEARERVSAQEAARYYGAEFDRRGWALCPFHRDTHPSMSFKDGRYHCWVCDVSGDSVDYVARLMDLRPMEALRRINGDFGLGLAIDRPPTESERQAAREYRQVSASHQDFEKWRAGFILRLNEAYRRGWTLNITGLDRLTDGEAAAYKMREVFEHYSDALTFGEPEEQAQVYRERGKIARWIERALRD